MSCHQIGHAANHMVNCIFKKYDNGEFGKDTAYKVVYGNFIDFIKDKI